jgi:hypothetical protein
VGSEEWEVRSGKWEVRSGKNKCEKLAGIDNN